MRNRKNQITELLTNKFEKNTIRLHTDGSKTNKSTKIGIDGFRATHPESMKIDPTIVQANINQKKFKI